MLATPITIEPSAPYHLVTYFQYPGEYSNLDYLFIFCPPASVSCPAVQCEQYKFHYVITLWVQPTGIAFFLFAHIFCFVWQRMYLK
jgi:hypothetical protein